MSDMWIIRAFGMFPIKNEAPRPCEPGCHANILLSDQKNSADFAAAEVHAAKTAAGPAVVAANGFLCGTAAGR